MPKLKDLAKRGIYTFEYCGNPTIVFFDENDSKSKSLLAITVESGKPRLTGWSWYANGQLGNHLECEEFDVSKINLEGVK